MSKIKTIKADKERHLKLGINSLIQLEEELGKPLTELSEGMGIKELRSILYVALRWEDKGLTVEKTGEIMDQLVQEQGFEKLGELIGDLAMGAMGILPSDENGLN